MKKIISYKDWIDFPRISLNDNGNNITTTSVTYKDKVLNIGDDLVWIGDSNDQREEFKVEEIRLNPTIRVCDSKGNYYLVSNCQKEYDVYENHC